MKYYATLYRDELLKEVIPFWEKFAVDEDYGGYFSCLNEQGAVYDTDKFVWLQARQIWMFSTLYQNVEAKKTWLDIAQGGAEFLQAHGRDREGHWYFSLNRKGEPLVQPYNIFSDCFAAMAFGKLHAIAPNKAYADIAKTTFETILKRQENPKGSYNKIVQGTRNLKNFALPMILCNLALELEPILGTQRVTQITDSVVDLIMNVFYDQTSGLVLENVSDSGAFVNSFEGRLLNPGHAIEAMWFVMNLAIRQNDTPLFNKAEKIMFQQLEYGWDDSYGGIFYFMDIKGYPPQQLEHDQKLWWVHLETLVALAKTYSYNRNPKARAWFEKVHEYTWSRFRDLENGGEWFGYLNRQGHVNLRLKGGKWKGCFHVPRGLLEVWKTLEKLEK